MKRFIIRIGIALGYSKTAVSSTHPEDLPLAPATFRSKELLITKLAIQCSLLLNKPNVGHRVFAVSTVKFFWVPRLPQSHKERTPAKERDQLDPKMKAFDGGLGRISSYICLVNCLLDSLLQH